MSRASDFASANAAIDAQQASLAPPPPYNSQFINLRVMPDGSCGISAVGGSFAIPAEEVSKIRDWMTATFG